MITELQKMYGKPPGVELQELVNMFHSCKQAEGQSVSDHVLLMKSYLDQLATLNYAFPDKVSISFILNSLSSEFQAFVQNYNMQSMEKTISEVHSLLIEFEKSIKRNKQQIVGASSTPHVMAIQSGRVQKNKPQGKAKGKEKGKGLKNSYPTKPKKPQPYKKERPAKDGQCHHCKEEGHWKRNCPLYLAELMKKKKTGGQNVASTSSGIYTIELFAFPKNSWVYDTGCGTHICNTKQGLRGAKKLKRGSLYLYVGNGVRAEVEAIGSFDLVLPNGLIIVLDNCHYAPSITRGVVSVSRLVNKGFTQCFTDFGLSVSMNNMIYFNAITVNGIYEIDMRDSTLPIVNSMYSISNKRTKPNLDSSYLWHCRLAHINKKRIEKLQHDGLLKPTDNEPFDQCVSCISGKMTRKPFSHKTEKVKDVLGLIHTDVCGPLRHVSKKGASYFITFTDDYSRYGYVYLLKHKHEVFETFKVFKNEVENQLGKTIKAIRSDRGGEYISQEFKDYLKAYGIVQQLTPPYTPQHNGVSERRNRTLLNMVRSMMSLTTLPLSFWDYALESAARILNMVPTKKVDKTPYELWHGKVPNLSYLKVWGCEAHVKRHTPDKLQQRSVKCIFVGYPKETMGYYFYYPPENKIVVERYADFLEKDFILQKESGRNVELDDEDILPSENTSEHPIEEESLAPIVSQEEDVVPVRRSVRTHKAPNRLCLNVEIDPDRLSFNIEVEEHSLGDLNEPANYKAALSDPEFEKWLVAMNEEMQSMNDNKVWKLVVLPPNAKVVKSKWIYKKKTDMDGKVYIYKARLVAKGFTQTYGVDYEETFSPVADIRAIRILIAIAAYYDYEIWQMDVKTAFLNGFLEEEIYMEQPEGFIDPNHPSKVCKLQRSIYGLKQASRSWNKRFDEEIKKFGFHQNLDEPCVYQKASGSNVIFLILYVDDIILMGNHIPSLQEVKDYLGKCFSMKDLGEAAFILGIKIYRDRSRRLIGLSQNAYLDKILKRYRMDNSKRGSIPMQVDLHLNKSQCATTSAEMKRMQNVPYASAVGSIMYAVRCTRPDVAFAQNITSRFQQNPGEAHWTAVKNILKYLRNTKDTFLVYGGNPEAELQVKCYCDAGFETDRDDTKSQTGYVFVLNGGAVVWKSSKQSTTAQHATEAEYIAASEAAKEAVWIRKFIDELGVVPSNDYPIKMNCDNSAAIIIAKESGIQKGARHFQRKYHYVRECIKTGEIDIVKVHTDENLADPFTKALAGPKLTRHARSMGLRPASSFM
ncbi:putative RNA-directed DNA polymerase [Tanacetum coccineum]|uniref:RNA-directed DNA polymerase n=4 Tax=Tanacetum coccineum TaxID=301880 RepID=A0ABQ5FIA4_9ASTR